METSCDTLPLPHAARSVVVNAPAKINLHLGIHEGRDERGYHRAESVMVALELCDEVQVSMAPAGAGLRVSIDPSLDVAGEKTLVARVARRLAEELGRAADLSVRVVRRIPDKSGLGSASTDAAATLRALCQLWGVDELDERVVGIARAAGADVAFFLRPEPSLLDGVGDCLRETYPSVAGVSVALVRPEGGVSTPAAYAEFDRCPEKPTSPGTLCAQLRAGGAWDASRLSGLLFNNLQDAAERLQPDVRVVRAWLQGQEGVADVLLCGSGSCVFALCESDEAASRVATDALACGWWSCATRTA